MLRNIAILLLFPALGVAQSPSAIPSSGEIPRFMTLAKGLYRGGQPSENGLALLKQNGVKTIINLRMENDESAIVQKLGMNYVHIPIEDVQPWSHIPEAAIAKYFEIVNNPANYPIFFHCRRGADRTGEMAAFYRMAIQGWSAEQAYSEALGVGMRPWYLGLKTQLYYFHPPVQAKLQPAIEAR